MTPHQLGLVLSQRLQGDRLDPRRLQATIGDLCGAEHSDLAAPLRSLVLSAAFASAAGQTPPLSDPRLLGRLQQELAEVYAAPLCQRLEPLLEGLLGMAATAPPSAASAAVAERRPAARAAVRPVAAAWAPDAAAPQGPADPAATATGTTTAAAPSRRSGVSPLTVLLAFFSGMLLMALAGVVLLLQQRSQPLQGSGSPPSAVPAERPSPPASEPPVAPTTPTSPGPQDAPPVSASPDQAGASGASAAGSEAAALDRSRASINALYAALSAKDYARARSLFAAAAADQFDPAFFDQFAQVSVQDLRPISQSGSSVTLEGVVTFAYPDGTSQIETRSFTLDGSSDPALITASAFGRVIKPR